MTSRLTAVFDAIDAANAADPNMEADNVKSVPAALAYGQRMTAELARMHPDASEPLQIAARGQHIERWLTPRDSYPEGRAGYLTWRKAQGQFHGTRVGEIMETAGYGPQERDQVGRMLRKEGIKRDPETQMLEDVICFVFMRWYVADFAKKHPREDVVRIVSKTARKMSENAREKALEEFDLPPDLAAAVKG